MQKLAMLLLMMFVGIMFYSFYVHLDSNKIFLRDCEDKLNKYNQKVFKESITENGFIGIKCQSMKDRIFQEKLTDIINGEVNELYPIDQKNVGENVWRVNCGSNRLKQQLKITEFNYKILKRKLDCDRNPEKTSFNCGLYHNPIMDPETFLAAKDQTIESAEDTYKDFESFVIFCNQLDSFPRHIVFNAHIFPKMLTQCIIFGTGRFPNAQKITEDPIYKTCYSRIADYLNYMLEKNYRIELNFDYKNNSDLLKVSNNGTQQDSHIISTVSKTGTNRAFEVFEECQNTEWEKQIEKTLRNRFCPDCSRGYFMGVFINMIIKYQIPEFLQQKNFCEDVLQNFDLYVIMNMKETESYNHSSNETANSSAEYSNEFKNKANKLFLERINKTFAEPFLQSGSEIKEVFNQLTKNGISKLEEYLDPQNKTKSEKDILQDSNYQKHYNLCRATLFFADIFYILMKAIAEKKGIYTSEFDLREMGGIIQYCANNSQDLDIKNLLQKNKTVSDFLRICEKLQNEGAIYFYVCMDGSMNQIGFFKGISKCFAYDYEGPGNRTNTFC